MISYTSIRNRSCDVWRYASCAFADAHAEIRNYRADTYSRKERTFIARGLRSQVLIMIGVVFLVTGGYFLTYDLFLRNLNISKLGETVGGEAVDFRYDKVAYFHGTSLTSCNNWELTYFAPWVLGLSNRKLEVFVEVLGYKEEFQGQHIGNLIVSHRDRDDGVTIPLHATRLQRFVVDWMPSLRDINTLVVGYRSRGEHENLPVHFAVVVASPGLLWAALLLLGLGAAAILLSSRPLLRFREGVGLAMMFLLLTGLGFYVHSGAFISQELFAASENRVTSGMARQLNHLFKHGTFRERNYRGAGVALLPLAVSIVEGGAEALRPSFQNVYPTSRYLIFTLFMGGVLFLGAATCRLEGAEVGLTFVALAVTFFPFIADLYNPDADALFIFFFPFFLAFLLRARFGLGGFWPNLIGALITFFLMGFTKITPVFLVMAAPLLALLPLSMPRLPKVFVAAGLALLLLVTFFAGGRVSEALQHPNRNIGIKGEPFQETVAWHMIWAAYGTFDHHSAHWFTKSARLRNERVRKITGLPDKTYVRHAQSASEQVYKPGVLQAFSERPGYFYATAFLRFYNHGLRFYRYTYGGDSSDVWEPWLDDGFRESRVISGEEVFGLSPEREAIRYDEAWKVSPLILLAKITQSDMTRLADLVLLILAFIGMIGMRHRGLGAFLVFCALAQIAFAFGIHGINRYFMFCSVALLLGLAYSLCQIVKVILGFRGKTSCLQ